MISPVDLGEQLAELTTLEQAVVAMVYFEGRTPAATAQALSVDQAVVGPALARAHRRIADWLIDEDGHDVDDVDTSRAPSSTVGLLYHRPASPAQWSEPARSRRTG